MGKVGGVGARCACRGRAPHACPSQTRRSLAQLVAVLGDGAGGAVGRRGRGHKQAGDDKGGTLRGRGGGQLSGRLWVCIGRLQARGGGRGAGARGGDAQVPAQTAPLGAVQQRGAHHGDRSGAWTVNWMMNGRWSKGRGLGQPLPAGSNCNHLRATSAAWAGARFRSAVGPLGRGTMGGGGSHLGRAPGGPKITPSRRSAAAAAGASATRRTPGDPTAST